MDILIQVIITLAIIIFVALAITYTMFSIATDIPLREMLSLSPVTTVMGIIGIAIIASFLSIMSAVGVIVTFFRD